MIISKPKFGTILSLSVFIAVSLVIASYGLKLLLNGQPVWWAYTLAILFYPIAISLIIKITWGYKIISVGSQKIEVKFPFRMQKKKYYLRQVLTWEETMVKTGSVPFKELNLRFDDGNNMKLSYHENSNYDEIFNYLNRNAAKGRKKT